MRYKVTRFFSQQFDALGDALIPLLFVLSVAGERACSEYAPAPTGEFFHATGGRGHWLRSGGTLPPNGNRV